MTQEPPLLQRKTVLCGGGFRYHCTATMPLSVKSFSGGSAHYRTSRGTHTVDEDCWLVLNDQEPYTIEFESKSFIRSTVIFFPEGWAESVTRCFLETEASLLDAPHASGNPIEFIETVTPDDGSMKPKLKRLDAHCRGQSVPDDWLAEQLREMLASMILTQKHHRERALRIPAAKASTRQELYQRLCRGRDFLHSHALNAPTLEQASRAASLSPFHFQRSFKAAFGVTPRRYSEMRRLVHARRFLVSDDLPATEVASAVGYESYSSFHAAYRRHFGHPPSKATYI